MPGYTPESLVARKPEVSVEGDKDTPLPPPQIVDGGKIVEYHSIGVVYNPDTKLIKSYEGEYHVAFPTKPTPFAGDAWSSSFGGLTQSSRRVCYEWRGPELVLTMRYRLTDSDLSNPADLKDIVDRWMDKYDLTPATPASSLRLQKTAEGLTYIELTGAHKAGSALFKMRIIHDHRREYMLMAEGTLQALNGPDAQKFFDSFGREANNQSLVMSQHHELATQKVTPFVNALKQYGAAGYTIDIAKTALSHKGTDLCADEIGGELRTQLGRDYSVGGAWFLPKDEKPYFYEVYNVNTRQELRIYFQKDGTFDHTDAKVR